MWFPTLHSKQKTVGVSDGAWYVGQLDEVGGIGQVATGGDPTELLFQCESMDEMPGEN